MLYTTCIHLIKQKQKDMSNHLLPTKATEYIGNVFGAAKFADILINRNSYSIVSLMEEYAAASLKLPEKMPTGARLILAERLKQLETKPIYKDVAEGLRMAAVYVLTLNDYDYPADWSEDFMLKCKGKSQLDRLTIAGALIAAAIDRHEYDDELPF